MAEAVNNDWGWPQFEDLLICPVCYNVPMGPIKTCVRGHHTCVMCRMKLDRCPMCKSTLAETRNYVMEEIVTNLQNIKTSMTRTDVVPDPARPNGPGAIEPKKKRRSLATPPQSKGSFPCRISGCGANLPVSRMLNHIRYFHGDRLHEGALNADGDTYTQMWEIAYAPCEKINAIRVEKTGAFFLVVHILPNEDVRIFMQMVASHTHAQQFMYTIKLSGDCESIYHVGRVISCREPFDQVVARKRCLVLLAEAMRDVCAPNANFKCHISIRYIGPPAGDTPAART